jgi:hypothetical protein
MFPPSDDGAEPIDHRSGGLWDDATMTVDFKHQRHARIDERKDETPTKVVDQLPTSTWMERFNAWVAVKVTSGVGTMWCAYLFGLIALVSLPAVLDQTHWFGKDTFPHWMVLPSMIVVVAWVAQTFLQLVLLSIIIVGQNIAGAASDKRAEATFNDADAVLHEAIEIQRHLDAQDQAIEAIVARLEALVGLTGPQVTDDGGGATAP